MSHFVLVHLDLIFVFLVGIAIKLQVVLLGLQFVFRIVKNMVVFLSLHLVNFGTLGCILIAFIEVVCCDFCFGLVQ